MKGKWWIVVLAVIVLAGGVMGVLVGNSQREKAVQARAFSIWAKMQDRSQDVISEVEGAPLNLDGLGKAKAELKKHKNWLNDQNLELGRLLGHSTFYSTDLLNSAKKEYDLFDKMYECSRDPSDKNFKQAEKAAGDLHHHGEDLQRLVSTAAEPPDDDKVEDALHKLSQIIKTSNPGPALTRSGSGQVVVVPPAPSSPVIAQLRQLLKDYKAVRLSTDLVIRRFTGDDYDRRDWSAFKSRSDYQFEISRRRNLLSRLGNVYSTSSYESALPNQFQDMVRYAIDTFEDSSTRADFRDRSKTLSSLVADLERRLR